jgi:hypothetical protein
MYIRSGLIVALSIATITYGGACSDKPSLPVSIVLDVPTGPLAPKPASTVELTVRSTLSKQDLFRTARVDAAGAFDLGEIPKITTGHIDAALRSESGGLLAYGRIATDVSFNDGGEITIPVRRPLLYIGAGTSVFDFNVKPNWQTSNAIFTDLSPGANPLDGSEQIASNGGYLVAAAGTMFALQQAINTDGLGTGAIQLVEVNSGDHRVGAPRPTTVTGDIREVAASDDGEEIAVATSQGAWLVKTSTGASEKLSSSAVDRIALRDIGNDHDVVILSGRVATTEDCKRKARLERINVVGENPTTTLISNEAISDIASANGRIFFSNVCTGRIFEVGNAASVEIKSTGRNPTNIVASDSQIWFTELGLVAGQQQFSLSSFTIGKTEPPIALWRTPTSLILVTRNIMGVQRSIDAKSADIDELTLVSNEFVAFRTRMYFDVPRPQSNLPATLAQTDSAVVVSAVSGAVAYNYQSWCEILETCMTRFPPELSDVCNWTCAPSPGVSTPSKNNERRVRGISATFQRR